MMNFEKYHPGYYPPKKTSTAGLKKITLKKRLHGVLSICVTATRL